MFCGLCGRNMVGVSATRNGRKHSYYACNGRLIKSGCRMDYVRADLIEKQIISDFSDLFRTRGMVEKVWCPATPSLARYGDTQCSAPPRNSPSDCDMPTCLLS